MSGPIRVRPTKGPVDVARLQRIEEFVNWYYKKHEAEIEQRCVDALFGGRIFARLIVTTKEKT